MEARMYAINGPKPKRNDKQSPSPDTGASSGKVASSITADTAGLRPNYKGKVWYDDVGLDGIDTTPRWLQEQEERHRERIKHEYEAKLVLPSGHTYIDANQEGGGLGVFVGTHLEGYNISAKMPPISPGVYPDRVELLCHAAVIVMSYEKFVDCDSITIHTADREFYRLVTQDPLPDKHETMVVSSVFQYIRDAEKPIRFVLLKTQGLLTPPAIEVNVMAKEASRLQHNGRSIMALSEVF